MKRLLLMLFFAAIFTVGYGQELKIDPVTSAISYEEVVSADSLSAVAILKLAKKWAITVFEAGKEMIEYYDEADSSMIIKPIIKVYTKTQMPAGYIVKEVMNEYIFHYKLEIETKEGRYRIFADDFKCEVKMPNGEMSPVESIFFDEEKVRAFLENPKYGLPKYAEKRMPKFNVEDLKQERVDLQNKLDENVREGFDSLKFYIRSRPKKKW